MTVAAASPPKTAFRWIVLGTATFAQATASFAMLGVAALAGFLQRDFRLSSAETGLLITATYGAAVLSLLFVGDLLDRKSERVIIGVGGAISFVALMLATLSDNFGLLLVWLFIAGLGFSATQPGGSKSVSLWFRGDRLGLAMGIRQAGLPLGGAVAAAILPAVAAAWSWRAAFIAGALATLAGAVIFAVVYRPPPEESGSPPRRPPLNYAAVRQLLRQPWMRSAMVAGLALVSAQYGLLTWLMLYLRDSQHLPLTRGAWLLFLAQAVGAAGRVMLAALSDRTPAARFRLLNVSMIAIAACAMVLIVLPSGTSELALALIALWLGFFGLGWYGPWVAYLAETAPADQVGLTLGAAMALNQVGIIAAPPLLGLIHDITGGYTAVWGAMVAVLTVAYLLTGLAGATRKTAKG